MTANNAFERTGEERGPQGHTRKMMRTAAARSSWPAVAAPAAGLYLKQRGRPLNAIVRRH